MQIYFWKIAQIVENLWIPNIFMLYSKIIGMTCNKSWRNMRKIKLDSKFYLKLDWSFELLQRRKFFHSWSVNQLLSLHKIRHLNCEPNFSHVNKALSSNLTLVDTWKLWKYEAN